MKYSFQWAVWHNHSKTYTRLSPEPDTEFHERVLVMKVSDSTEKILRNHCLSAFSNAHDLLMACKAFVHWYDTDSTEFNRDTAYTAAKKAIDKCESKNARDDKSPATNNGGMNDDGYTI